MDTLSFLEELFDPKVIKILKIFLGSSSKEFYLKELSDLAGVSMATSHRILKKLSKLEIINERNISKFKIYQLADNKKVVFLSSFIKESSKGVDIFLNEVKNLPGLKRVILHGKEKSNRANILLIGEDINSSKVKEIVANIKEKHNYTITHLALAEDQYNQMSTMGLYPGEKKILFEK